MINVHIAAPAPGDLPHAGMTQTALEGYVQEHLQTVRMLARRTAEETWLVGKALSILRPIYSAKGEWLKYVDEVLGIGSTTAADFVKIGRAFDDIEEVRKYSVQDLRRVAGCYYQSKTLEEREAEKEKKRKKSEEPTPLKDSEADKKTDPEGKVNDKVQPNPPESHKEGSEKPSQNPGVQVKVNDRVQPKLPVPSPEADEDTLVHKLTTVTEEIGYVNAKIGAIRSRRQIDLAKLTAARDELNRVIVRLRKLPG